MHNTSIKYQHIIPVLFSFFIMSFIDLVGTGVDELKSDLSTPPFVLQLIPFVAFIWFFLLSVLVGLWQKKQGKKTVLNYGIALTAVGLFVPILGNSLPVILGAFTLLGIGNTILQVAANPLLVDVVPSHRSSSFLSFAQFVKAIGSMVGPFAAAILGPWLAHQMNCYNGEWRFGLYLFGVLSVLTFFWLNRVHIPQNSKDEKEQANISTCLKLLSNRFTLLMVLGIFLVVGLDVAINSNIGTLMTQKFHVSVDDAKYSKTLYFFAKMVGTFLGAMLLVKIDARKFLTLSAIITIVSFGALIVTTNSIIGYLLICTSSLGIANIFPLIFSISVNAMPKSSNEISGLMMMAISGGAIIPFVTGLASQNCVTGGIIVWLLCSVYLLAIALFNKFRTESSYKK